VQHPSGMSHEDSRENQMKSERDVSGYCVVRTLLGMLLLTAGGLKLHQLAAEPVAAGGLFATREWLIAEAEAEIVFGLWMLGGLLPRLTWTVALGCFSVFCGVAVYKGLTGAASCGCFGKLSINPWYTLVLDVAAVAALALCRPALRTPTPIRQWRWRLAGVVALGLLIGIPAGVVAALYEPARLGDDGRIEGDDQFVVLEPEAWPGKRMGLLRHIDTGEQLAKGRWTVVLYRHDCPHCRKEIGRFERTCRKTANTPGRAGMAMIELPPYAHPGKSLLASDTPCLRGKVSDKRKWFVETPVALSLADGVVKALIKDDDDLNAAAPPTSTVRPPVTVKDGMYNFGSVLAGSKHEATLSLPHFLKGPVTVRKVLSECKCMKGSVGTGQIAAGKPITLRVTLVAPKEQTRYSKRFLLKIDPSAKQPITVRIKANIYLPLSVEPEKLDFGKVPVGRESRRTITIHNRSRTPARLIYALADGIPSDTVGMSLPAAPISPGGTASFPITLTPQAPGHSSSTLQLRTGHPIQPSIRIPITFAAASEH